ncbi:hypothetical protein BD560DRAFT_423545 [Blakeslea trispora]|nr:hypothetical protein BD560DRAFT_423545 [Blakeslea trispora]
MTNRPDTLKSTVLNDYYLRSRCPQRKRKRYNLSPSLSEDEGNSHNMESLTDDSDESEPRTIVPIGKMSFHCVTCAAFFMNQADLTLHNQNCHKKKKNDPDPNHPLNYCSSCNFHYKNRASYFSHLRNIHFMRNFSGGQRARPVYKVPDQNYNNLQQANDDQKKNENDFSEERRQLNLQQSRVILLFIFSLAVIAFVAFAFVKRVSK